jgi:hypothetical protein
MGLLRVVSSLEVFLLLKGPFVFWPLFSPHQSRALDGLSSDNLRCIADYQPHLAPVNMNPAPPQSFSKAA